MKRELTRTLLCFALFVPWAGCGSTTPAASTPESENGDTNSTTGESGSESTSTTANNDAHAATGNDDEDLEGHSATTNTASQQNAATTSPRESPWGAPDAESGEPLPPRRPMTGSALDSYRQGIRQATAGDYTAARRSFEQALAADGNAFRAAYNLGVIADRTGHSDEALGFYQRALQIQPDYERALDGAITIYVRQNQAAQAVSFVEPIARRWTRNLHVQAAYGAALVSANRPQEAVTAARAALRRDERFVPAMIVLVKANLKLGRNELAEDILNQALAIDANNAEAHFLKGRMLGAQNQLAAAMAEYRRAIEIRSDYADARMALGLQLLGGANYDEALRQFQEVVRLAPDQVEGQLALGDAFRSTKQWEKAKATFERVQQMRPQMAEVHFNLALMYTAQSGDITGPEQLAMLQAAQTEFTSYRSMMGSRLGRDDPSTGYLEEIGRGIERTKRAIERDAARRQRDAERAARGQAPLATADAGT